MKMYTLKIDLKFLIEIELSYTFNYNSTYFASYRIIA